MRKFKILILVFVLSMFFFNGVSVSAEQNYVFDMADLLTLEEEIELQDRISVMKDIWEMNFLVVTTDDVNGKTTRNYADDFYDACFPETSQEDGMIYLIDMENREIYLSTSGIAIRYMTDERVDDALDAAFDEVADGNYYAAFVAFLDKSEDYINMGIPEDQYNYEEDTGNLDYYDSFYDDMYQEEKTITGTEVMIAVIAGLLVSIGTCAVIVGKYRLKFEDFHYDAYTDSDVKLYVNESRLINSFVTHRRIPRNNNGGGSRSSGGGSRSTIHHSSSGRSHGGGGRKF